MALGYLCDVDGTITTRYGEDSPVDRRVIERFPDILKGGGRIAIITGRSEWWLDEHVIPLLKEYKLLRRVLVLGEYIYFKISGGRRSWDPSVNEFKKDREAIKRKIAELSQPNIPTSLTDARYAPETGELWFEPGVGILSVRTNPHNSAVDSDFVYDVTKRACNQLGFRGSALDIKKSPIATVVSRPEAHKGNSARIALEILDPENKVERWYAFGDSDMDERMVEASPGKIHYVSVKGMASSGVLEFLDNL